MDFFNVLKLGSSNFWVERGIIMKKNSFPILLVDNNLERAKLIIKAFRKNDMNGAIYVAIVDVKLCMFPVDSKSKIFINIAFVNINVL